MDSDPDNLLEILLIAAGAVDDKTDGGEKFTVTLSLHGTLVTGTIISAIEYRLSNRLLEALDEVTAKIAKDKKLPELDFKAVYGSGFIHLKDVCFDGLAHEQPSLGYFRARLASVDGFRLW